ncbi:MAG: pyridoxal phosphate-dependent aminotransferase [bacterium]|nr:pyridoxal phosphate-dependent aminotransferase [bacterium]
MQKLSDRIKSIKPSATLAISAKIKTLRAQGIDVIGFSAGEPDFDTPEYIKNAAISSIKNGFTKYTPASGTLELKKAVCDKFGNDNGLDYTSEQVIVSCGAKHSLYNLIQVMCNPDDEVIIPIPYWVSYPDMVKLAGAKPVFIQGVEKNAFKILPDELENAITEKTKILIINSPSNPCGTVYSKDELMEIADIACKHDIYVIADEIYEEIIYDGIQHISIASLNSDIKERTIVVNGVSKTYSMTGWRIGYAAGDTDIIKAAGKLQSQSTSNPTSISQKAALTAIQKKTNDVAKMVNEFGKRRDYIVGRLNDMDNVSCQKPKGAFYVFPNISAYYGKEYNGNRINTDIDFCNFLLDIAKVGVIPGSAFGSPYHIRMSYATSMENIKEGIDRMESALKELR